MNPHLQQRPVVERWQAGSGSKSIGKIDPTGGRYSAGIIPGASMCSRGEALGHGQWVDGVMLQQIVDLCNANTKLLKSRFAHPDMCGDGTGKALGTIENAALAGDQAIGDMHFYQTAHRAPDGDLAGYVLSLASEDPENFGMSIVFEHDFEAEEAFMLANGGEWVTHDDGYGTYQVIEGFVSPDPQNTENYPHARIKALRASDVVDDPAANRSGLFHRKNDLLSEGVALLDYATGKTDQPPAASSFNIAPERIREFLTKYLAASGLSLQPAEKKMDSPKDETDPKDETTTEDPKADKSKGNPDDAPEDPPTNNADTTDKEKQSTGESCTAEKLSRFVSKFGAVDGSKWAIEGITYETALERHCDALKTDLADANSRLEAIGTTGTKPVKFSHSASGKSTGTTTQTADKLTEVCGEGLGRIAAAIKLPKPSNN